MIYAHSCTKIFGWTFDDLQITVQRYHCEDLYAAGRMEEATAALLKILDTFNEEIHASRATSEWVMGEHRHANQVGMNNVSSQISGKNVSRCLKASGTRRSALGSTTRRLHGIHLHCLSVLQTE